MKDARSIDDNLDMIERMDAFKETLSQAWDSGRYDFITLSIYLNDTASLEKLKAQKEQASCFATLVHEYIHFIQNFTTPQGFTSFITFVDLFAHFFVQNMGLAADPAIPTRGGIVDTSVGAKTYANFEKSLSLGLVRSLWDGKPLFNSTTRDNFTFVAGNVTDPYHEKTVFLSNLAYNDQLIPLNTLVIRENMAAISTFLASGLSREAAKERLLNWSPQYNIIYKFLDHYLPEKDCFKLTYFIAEISLFILPYNKTIHKLLLYVKDNNNELLSLDENGIIERIKALANFDQHFRPVLASAQALVDRRIETYLKHANGNEFYVFVITVLRTFQYGFSERLNNPFSYRGAFDIAFINHYASVIKSPIIIFPDNKKTMLGKVDPDYINAIANFSGILAIFRHTYSKTITQCPFAEEHSLCDIEKGDECYKDSLSVFGLEQYNGCLMSNALRIIGLKKEGRF